MQEFIKIPASAQSLAQRKPIYGVGINDANYITKPKINGKRVMCPAYRRWSAMLARCYCPKYQEKRPTYKGCSVCDDWLVFSNFAEWYNNNSVDGHHLDKDIKIKGNKVYSPKSCLFTPMCINSLLNDHFAGRGKFQQGVSFICATGMFKATVGIDGKNKHLGFFCSDVEAREYYVIAKNAEIKRKCDQYPEFAKYLINHLL